MFRLAGYFAAGLIVAITATPSSAKGPFGSIKVGQWTGGAFTNDNTGTFSHCSALAPYISGTLVNFAQNADLSWTIGFGNSAFHLTPGETFPIDVTLDGKDQIHLFGTALQPQIVYAAIPSTSVLN